VRAHRGCLRFLSVAVVTVEDVREFARTLPRSTEGVVRGRLKLYIGRIVYVAFSRDETVMGFAFPREWRVALVESEPEKFMLPTGGDLRYQWVLARMEELGLEEMREYVLDAWGMVVPKRVREAYLEEHPIA
jgi:hypothetical protein